MVDIGKESSPEGGAVFQCKGEWRRKRDPDDQEGRSPRKQSKIDNFLVPPGEEAPNPPVFSGFVSPLSLSMNA